MALVAVHGEVHRLPRPGPPPPIDRPVLAAAERMEAQAGVTGPAPDEEEAPAGAIREGQKQNSYNEGYDMKLSTIWTLRGMSLRERLNRTGEAATIATAARLPKRIAYWSFILVGSRHMRSDETVPEVRYTDLLQRAGDEVTR